MSGTRRRVLWTGMFVMTATAAVWAVLSRRPTELAAPPPPAPVPASTANGSAPVGQGVRTD